MTFEKRGFAAPGVHGAPSDFIFNRRMCNEESEKNAEFLWVSYQRLQIPEKRRCY